MFTTITINHIQNIIFNMSELDQELTLLNKQVQKIHEASFVKDPFTISSFNEQFDQSLKQLAIYYKFDFDKIALHLYYEYPQYQQKINSRTIGFRWWQVQKQRQIKQGRMNEKEDRCVNGKEDRCVNEKEDRCVNEKEDRCVNGKEDRCEQEEQADQNKFQKSQENRSLHKANNQFPWQTNGPGLAIADYDKYSKALELSQILTQQQSQRFILYKPKFIMDTEYQLQRYEVDEQLRLGEGHNDPQQLPIGRLLRKVVDNQFEYDQFGSFEGMAFRDEHGRQARNQQGQQPHRNWWEPQIQSQSQSYSDQQISQLEQGNENHQCNQYRLNLNQIHSNISRNNSNIQNPVSIQVEKPQQKYIHDNWDQYQSD